MSKLKNDDNIKSCLRHLKNVMVGIREETVETEKDKKSIKEVKTGKVDINEILHSLKDLSSALGKHLQLKEEPDRSSPGSGP